MPRVGLDGLALRNEVDVTELTKSPGSKEEGKAKLKRDEIFRKAFGYPPLLLMFLKDYVKQDWVNALKVEDLERLSREFPSLYAADRAADVVFKVRLAEREMYLLLLLEHQSSVNHFMPFRVLEYMVLIWRYWLENIPKETYERRAFRLPQVVPIVFYDGRGAWTADPKFSNKVLHLPELARYVPHFEHRVIELSKISSDDLEKCANALSLIFLIDKCDSEEDVEKAREMRTEYWESVKESLKDSQILEIVAECVQALLARAEASPKTTQEVIDDLRKGRLPEMFEHSLSQVREKYAMWRAKEAQWVEKEAALTSEKDALTSEKDALRLNFQEALSLLFMTKFGVTKDKVEFFLKECDAQKLTSIMAAQASIRTLDDLKEFIEKI
jgi:hypothetical protein